MKLNVKLDTDLKIEILNHCPQYLNEIASWHYEEWSHLYPENKLKDFIFDLQECLSEDSVPSTWVLIDKKRVIGSASILKHDMSSNKNLSPWLANVFIRSEHRGQGLGSHLVKEVIKEASHKGLPKLYLFTADQADFYKKFGWKVVKQEMYNNENVSVMSINLLTST